MKKYIFPSIVESHNSELPNVAPDFLHGIKLYHNNIGYVVGNLALSEGQALHKVINCSPQDNEYQILLKSGLLIASMFVDKPITLTVGFPFATYHMNRQYVAEIVGDLVEITFDASLYGGHGILTQSVEIGEIDVVPEIEGCIIGARKGTMQQEGALFHGQPRLWHI